MQSICTGARNNKIFFQSYFTLKMAIICYFKQFISCFGIDFDKNNKDFRNKMVILYIYNLE